MGSLKLKGLYRAHTPAAAHTHMNAQPPGGGRRCPIYHCLKPAWTALAYITNQHEELPGTSHGSLTCPSLCLCWPGSPPDEIG
jgi:hypothetical protein